MLAMRGFCRMLLLFWLMLLSCMVFQGIGSTPEAFVAQSLGKRRPSSFFYTSSDQSNVDGGGRVNVEVSRTVSFPKDSFQGDKDSLAEASSRVREAWMEYHWKKGGGLPIVILEKEDEDIDGDDVSESSSIESSKGKKRVIAPVLMEETISSFPLQSDTDDSKASLQLEYKVTSPGPFFGPDLVEGSRIGRVTFSSSYDEKSSAIATKLVWSVEFDAIRLLDVYHKVTEFTIGTAATTVQEAASTPRLLTISTKLPVATVEIGRQKWLDFLFSTSGCGLPLPPPIPFGEILPEGGGIARKKLFRFPGIVETAMVEGPMDVEDGAAMAYYRLENPGWFTFPFLFHTHLGRVRFSTTSLEEKEDDESTVYMIWEVEIRPYAFAAPIVEKLVEMTVTTIARNLRTHLEAPGAMVEIVPLEVSILRATWIGSVVEANSKDTRSTWDKSISFLQPWTWGNAGNGRRGEDEVVFEWSDGRLQ